MWSNDKSIFHDGARLWVTPDVLRSYGVSDDYIRKACAHERRANAGSWVSLQNPYPGVRLLIDYESIPHQTRESKALPPAEQLLNRLKKAAENPHNALRQAVDEALEFSWDRYMILYTEEPLECRRELAQAAAVLDLACRWRKGNYGFRRKAEFYGALGQELDRLQLKYWRATNPDRVGRTVNAARKSGVADVIRRPNAGNDHRRKVTAFHKWMMTAYYAHPMKYTAPMIASFLRYQCQVHGFEMVSDSTVEQYIARREIQTLTYQSRYGAKAYSDFLRPFISRKPVTFASDLWVMDGTRANFAYIDEAGRPAFLDVYMVLDAHSWKVLGFSVAENEDRWMVLDALKMAISLSGHLPAEMLFDNFSAKSTEEVQGALEQLQAMGTQVRYAKVGNARDKHIERGFEAWQNLAARYYPNFVGEGVKSRRDNARPAPEWIAGQRKKLPNREGVMRQIADAISIYNEAFTHGGKKAAGTPNGRFERSEKPNVYAIQPEQIADIFWATTTTKMRNATIRFQVRNVEYEYQVTDYDVWKRYDCNTSSRQIKVRVRYDERDMSSIYLFDARTNDFLCTCEQKVAVAGDAANMTEGDRRRIMGMDSRIKSWEQKMQAELAGMQREAEREIASDASLELVTDVAVMKKELLKTAENKMMRDYFYDQNDLAEIPADDTEPDTWSLPTPKARRAASGLYDSEATLDVIDE